MTVVFMIGPFFGLPLIGRYVRTPAVLLALFYGLAVCGWMLLDPGRGAPHLDRGSAARGRRCSIAFLPWHVGCSTTATTARRDGARLRRPARRGAVAAPSRAAWQRCGERSRPPTTARCRTCAGGSTPSRTSSTLEAGAAGQRVARPRATARDAPLLLGRVPGAGGRRRVERPVYRERVVARVRGAGVPHDVLERDGVLADLEELRVRVDDGLALVPHPQHALVSQTPVAQFADRAERMGDEHDRAGLAAELAILSVDLRRKRASPTDSASSMSRMSGSMLTATENASRPYMPARVGAHRHVHVLAELGELDDLLVLLLELLAPEPGGQAAEHARCRARSARVEADAQRQQRGDAAAHLEAPVVGGRMPAIVRISVDLPAPLAPTTPSTVPWGTSNETPLTASISRTTRSPRPSRRTIPRSVGLRSSVVR